MSLLLTARQTAACSPLPKYVCQQCRNATLLKRPKRPYTFTQLVTLSDGSSFMHRTTSPAPVYRATKDTRNNPLWNPSSAKLANLESDEAGRLRAFRAKFGRGWDAKSTAELSEDEDLDDEEGGDSLLDLISGGYVNEEQITSLKEGSKKDDK